VGNGDRINQLSEQRGIMISLLPKIVATNIRERRDKPGAFINRSPSDVCFGSNERDECVVNHDINLVGRNAPRTASRDAA
jgi:hypothetical protein